jgi:hypothetical protein
MGSCGEIIGSGGVSLGCCGDGFSACSDNLGFCDDDGNACGDGTCGNTAKSLTWKEENNGLKHSRQVELKWIVVVEVVKTVALALVGVAVAIVTKVKEMMLTGQVGELIMGSILVLSVV